MLWPLAFTSQVLTLLLSRRGLCLGFLAVMALLTNMGWLRPPLSDDIRNFHLPLLGCAAQGLTASAVLYRPRAFICLSPGALMLVLIAVGAIVVWRKPERFQVAAGLLLCGVLGCLASIVFNHPELVEQLDRQHEQRRQLVSLMGSTAAPPVRITDTPRVEQAADEAPPGALLQSLVYLRTHGLLALWLPVLACLLSTKGPLHRRLGYLGLWCLAGVLFAGGVSSRRLSAEWQWEQAVQADRRGAVEAAERHARAALERFPELARLERTWALLGKLDYRQGRSSPAARCFCAFQMAHNKKLRQAIGEIDDLMRELGTRDSALSTQHSALRSLLADLESELGFNLFHQEHFQGAENAWCRALERDPAQVFRRLFVATLRARVDHDDPEAIAAVVDPLLDRLTGDRTLRAALLAMLGDSYFRAGQFSKARARYEESMDTYNLPKRVNYRAQRGLVGM